MKVVMYEEANSFERNAFAQSIAYLRDLYGDLAYPTLDEHFEKEFKSVIMYTRDKGIVGFSWKNEADYTWFLLRMST